MEVVSIAQHVAIPMLRQLSLTRTSLLSRRRHRWPLPGRQQPGAPAVQVGTVVNTQRRAFRSSDEYERWSRRVEASAKRGVEFAEVGGGGAAKVAPILCEVNPYAEQRLKFGRIAGAPVGTSSHAAIETTWPVSTDPVLAKDVRNLQDWAAVRLGKFYEALDALTGDSAYLHILNGGGGADDDGADDRSKGRLALVTAGHYFSRKVGRTLPDQDFVLRCYPTHVGNSSIEIRTDAFQNGHLMNFCHTIMVCLDPETHRPVKGKLPPLLDDPMDRFQTERSELAELHAQIRRCRAEDSMSLSSRNLTHPPTEEEMRGVHEMQRNNASRAHYVKVSDNTHSNKTVVFPEMRNLHGKTFGGFVVAQAFDLAYMAAEYYTRGRRFVSLGVDEATFLMPVGIGDLLNFQTRVVHADAGTGVFRVTVNVDVLDRADPAAGRPKSRTNFLRFIFASNPSEDPVQPLLPESYEEILSYVSAARRHAVEPVQPGTLLEISKFLSGFES